MTIGGELRIKVTKITKITNRGRNFTSFRDEIRERVYHVYVGKLKEGYHLGNRLALLCIRTVRANAKRSFSCPLTPLPSRVSHSSVLHCLRASKSAGHDALGTDTGRRYDIPYNFIIIPYLFFRISCVAKCFRVSVFYLCLFRLYAMNYKLCNKLLLLLLLLKQVA